MQIEASACRDSRMMSTIDPRAADRHTGAMRRGQQVSRTSAAGGPCSHAFKEWSFHQHKNVGGAGGQRWVVCARMPQVKLQGDSAYVRPLLRACMRRSVVE